MVLNKFGQIVFNEIKNISEYKKNVKIDEFIVMPNHVHIIIIINKNGDLKNGNVDLKNGNVDLKNGNVDLKNGNAVRDAMNRVSTIG